MKRAEREKNKLKMNKLTRDRWTQMAHWERIEAMKRIIMSLNEYGESELTQVE